MYAKSAGKVHEKLARPQHRTAFFAVMRINVGNLDARSASLGVFGLNSKAIS